jgi:hypothetical protein
MSPNGRGHSSKAAAPSNIYTVILAMACGVVIATAAFVAYKCFSQYDSILKVAQHPTPRMARLKNR